MAKVHAISDSDSDDEAPTQRSEPLKPTKLTETTKKVFSISTLIDASSSEDEARTAGREALSTSRKRKSDAQSRNSSDEETDIDIEMVEKLERRHERSKAKCARLDNSQVTSSAHAVSDIDDQPVISNELADKGQPTRSACRFGLDCYRRLPSHWNKVSHPDEVSSNRNGKTVWTRPSFSQRSFEDDSDQEDEAPSAASFDTENILQVIEEAQPYGYYLTKVAGIDDRFNQRGALSLRDILSPSLGTLESSVQFSYLFDLEWMMSQYPSEARSKPLLIVHGLHRQEKAELVNQASLFSPFIKLCQARLPDPFGTHHTKMMILQYKEGLRVAITTANLVAKDWSQKTQGIWLSPLFPLANDLAQSSDSETCFKKDLIDYLRAYKASELKPVEDMLQKYDMSSAKVYLLASIPGRHQGSEKFKWGHMRLRRILEENAPPKPGTPTLNVNIEEPLGKSWYLTAQFSSVGSMGSNANQWLNREFAQSLSAMNPRGRSAFDSLDGSVSKLKLVFPCVEDVRNSLEGYAAGASLPYARATAAKQAWLKSFIHKWRADKRGRTLAAPHIKSFAQIDPSHSKAAWFVSTSANLSKAAWGALEKNQSQLFIRSYELGIVFVPKRLDKKSIFFNLAEGFLVPIDLPLTPYGQFDEPWLWDVNYTKKLDSHGATWEPNK